MTGSSVKHSDAPVAVRTGAGQPRLVWLLGFAALLCGLAMLSVTIGTRHVAWSELLAALGGVRETIGEAAVALRMPRTTLAILAGASLGLAGAIMQGITRNPLADPGLLGVNMGASLAVAVGVAWFGMSAPQAFIWTAIGGAAAAALFVYSVGSLGRGGATPLKLALSGAATSVAFASLLLALILPRADIAGGLQAWQIGGVGGATVARITPVLPFLGVGLLAGLLSARKLNALALGDELAAGLGENVVAARAFSALAAVLLCGATTAVCGPIAFVGLVVPHLCRLLVGVDHRWLLPCSTLGGACLLVTADILGRIVARPAEIDVGIVTALLGAPFFIAVVRRQRVRDL